jgi:RNA polymerase sigma-70 factor (ECF subfamily)
MAGTTTRADPGPPRRREPGAEPAGRPPGDGSTDEELLLASARDPDAFGELYRRHVQAVLTWSYRRTGCPETAADLTAETFAQAFLSRARYRATGAPARAWLFGIARHELGRLARRGRVAERARGRMGMAPVPLDEESITRIEALVDFAPVRAAIAGLSPAVRPAVLLRVGYELPYDEIARRLGCSVGAARVRVVRGLQQLGAVLRDHESADWPTTARIGMEGASS